MGIKINTVVTGKLTRAPKGSGPRGGRPVIEDTGRTLVAVATEMGERVIDDTTLNEMGAIMVEEVRAVTPKKTHALEESIRAETTKSKKGKAQVRVKAGGPDFPRVPNSSIPKGLGYVNYAVVVHEENTPYMFIGMANARQKVEEAIAKGAKRTLKDKK